MWIVVSSRLNARLCAMQYRDLEAIETNEGINELHIKSPSLILYAFRMQSFCKIIDLLVLFLSYTISIGNFHLSLKLDADNYI